MKNKYAKAYKEVLEILKTLPKEEYNKIPGEKVQFYKDNMDQTYEFTIDSKVDLSKQKISKAASAILVTLFQDFFATEKQKEKIKKILELNQRRLEQEKKNKFNPDSLFKSNK